MTVGKNSYAEHEVTGETYNLKKEEELLFIQMKHILFIL